VWSNLVVAVSLTLLTARPHTDTLPSRVLRLSGLLIITVTAIVYQALLAPGIDVTGWSRLTDPILHVVTPTLTVAGWLVWGPRGWVTGRVVPLAMTIPMLWIGWMLARGAVVGTYPYDFANVTELGYLTVVRTLGGIVIFGLVVATSFWGIDVVLGRRQASAGTSHHSRPRTR
jgi:hypothetical protein